MNYLEAKRHIESVLDIDTRELPEPSPDHDVIAVAQVYALLSISSELAALRKLMFPKAEVVAE